MGWANILALLDGNETDRAVATTALAIGKAFDATVEGLIVRPDPREAVRLAIDGMSPAMIEGVIDAARDEAERRIVKARDSFTVACGEASIPLETAATGAGACATWHEKVGTTADSIANHGRLSDLVIVGHPTRRGSDDADIAVETVLFETSCPLLLAGPEPLDPENLKVLVAWNGGRESALAVHAALPLLRRAERVAVVEVNGEGIRGPTGKELCAYLARHGINATAELLTGTDKPVPQMVLDHARETGAGLLVMGAYGHSRLRELVLGGVTRQMLIDAELPVLMAH